LGEALGISVKKSDDLSEWYTQVVLKAEVADYAPVKGFMVLRPYGYAIWERIKEYFDRKIKETGHRNAYFPSLIPEAILRKEAEHFAGFNPEVFWVTQSGDAQLSERLAVRPTSETIAYAQYAKWIRSWRDLPLLLNFWNSVLRAEIKATKPFLRTSEFLWQEGHTVHETEEEAAKEVMEILEAYIDLIENLLAIPVLAGRKTDRDKFVGAVYTTTLEAIMPDGKALQMGTSHNLGQNFSKPFEIKYLGRDEKEHYAWQTSWGISWRLIGATVMVHGDDKGLVLPPGVAPIHMVIVPIYYKEADRTKINSRMKTIVAKLSKAGFNVHVDDREQYTPGWKFNEWEMKGVPLRIEIGPKELERRQLTAVRRDNSQKTTISEGKLASEAGRLLQEIQKNLLQKARRFLQEHTASVTNYSEFKRALEEKGGFIRACWCSNSKCEESIKADTGAEIRLTPLKKEEVFSNCICCGREASEVAYFARAY